MIQQVQKSLYKTFGGFLGRNLVGQKEWNDMFKELGENKPTNKNNRRKFLTKYTSELSFWSEAGIKAFWEKQKWKELSTSGSDLQEMLVGV